LKKFVLVIICSLLLIVLIAFNYLLWDREAKKVNIQKLESTKADNDAIISELYKQRQNLENENTKLKIDMDELQKSLNEYKKTNLEISRENTELKNTLEDAISTINILKKQVGIETIRQQLETWAENISKSNYVSAYDFEKQAAKREGIINYKSYENYYKESIKTIEIKSLKNITGDIPKNCPDGVHFSIEINVMFKEGLNKDITGYYNYVNGVNKRIIAMEYDEYSNKWIIACIVQIEDEEVEK